METTTAYQIVPISHADAARLRDAGGEVYVADSMPGYPCRQCLTDAEIGDELILVSYDPFGSDSPYRSASPIFLHRHECVMTNEVVPLQLTRRQLSVRSFDADEMMLDAAVIDGSDLEATIDRLFVDPAAQRIHIHNAQRGCWATWVDRSTIVAGV